MRSFRVALVGEHIDGEEFYSLGLAESTDPDAWETCHSIQLQYLEDEPLCLVEDYEANTLYDGVRSWRLADGFLELRLHEDAAEEAQTHGYRLDLRGLGEADMARIEEGLLRALPGVLREG